MKHLILPTLAVFVLAGAALITKAGPTTNPSTQPTHKTVNKLCPVGKEDVDPKVTIETGNRTFTARASVAPAGERDRLWEQHVAALPQFGAYPEKTGGRVIPMVTITPDEG
jgi:hypothetical protein